MSTVMVVDDAALCRETLARLLRREGYEAVTAGGSNEALHLQRAFRPFTRCMTCNGGLVAIARGDVADLVPPRVYRRFRSFKQCKECRRVYWRGTHFVRLQRLVERYRQSPAATNAAQ